MMHRYTRALVFGADGYPVAAERYRVDEPIEVHSHDFLELAVVVDGAITHVTREGRRCLEAGSVLVMRPGGWHGYADPEAADVFNLYLGPELLRRELIWLLDHPDLARFMLQGGVSIGRLDPEVRRRVAGWLHEIETASAVPGAPSAILAVGLVSCVLGEIAALGFSSGRNADVISPTVREAMRLMTDDPAVDWSMPTLGARLNVSVSHLHRQFTAQVGSSPMAWLATVRAELAAVLLIQSDRTIAEIGRRVGWPDANYAGRRFRQAYGISPSRYRERFRGPRAVPPAGNRAGAAPPAR